MAKNTSMSGLQRLQARGSTGMRNDTSMTAKSQHPENKDPGEVTPGPQYQPIRMKLPKSLESDAHRTGKMVTHLAKGHHVKNEDGSTSFHMHELDGEPVGQDDLMPENDSMGEQAATGGGIGRGSPYGVSEALKGLSM